MSLLALIPARGGSKEIFRKNIKLLNGKPLIAYTIQAAKKSKAIDRIIVSTDCAKIASISRKYGAEVPFLRKKKYSSDATPVSASTYQFVKRLKRINSIKIQKPWLRF